MSRYIRGVEWADRSTDSNYPLIPAATGLDETEVFQIPRDLLSGMTLGIPADLLLSPAKVWIRSFLHTSGLLSVRLSGIVNGVEKELGQFDISTSSLASQAETGGYAVAVFAGTEEFYDLRGQLLFRGLNGLERQPQGEFFFEFAAAGVDPDCVRPYIRHVSKLVVENNNESNLTGAVRLAAGSNMRLRVEIEDDQPVVYFDALDASDLNEELECDFGTLPPIRRVNGLTGDAQRQLTLIGSRCLEPIPLENELQLRNRCSEPCASCDEAEAVKSLIAPFQAQVPTLVNLINRLDAAITATQANVGSSSGNLSECNNSEA